jgi:hypothetical protein
MRIIEWTDAFFKEHREAERNFKFQDLRREHSPGFIYLLSINWHITSGLRVIRPGRRLLVSNGK